MGFPTFYNIFTHSDVSALGDIFVRKQSGSYDDFPIGILVFAHEGLTNAPGSSLYYVITWSTKYDKYQIAFDYNNSDIFTRTKIYQGNWGAWKSR